MRKKYHVDLSDGEQKELREIISKRAIHSEVVKRAYILLAADRNGEKRWEDEQIAKTYEVAQRTVERIRERFVLDGVKTVLEGKPREYKGRVFDGEVEAKLIALRCSEPGEGHSRWSLRLLSDKMVQLEYVEAISHESIRQILKKNEMKPWQVKEWVIPEASAEFVCQMEEVLEVYARPYNEQHPVVCFDESPQQLVSEVRQSYTDEKGIRYEDYEYKREGAAEVFLLTEPLSGHREVFVEEDHTGVTWAKKMAYIAMEMYPNASKVTIIQDNLSAHKKHNLYKVFEPATARSIIDKIEFVYTPPHGSWLNIAECELSILSRQALDKRFPSKEQLEQQVTAWQNQRNLAQKGVDWQFTTKDARIKLKRLYPTIIT
jgi:transposase